MKTMKLTEAVGHQNSCKKSKNLVLKKGRSSVGKGWGRAVENFDFSYLIYWIKQDRGIEN